MDDRSFTARVADNVQTLVDPGQATALAPRMGLTISEFNERYAGQVAWSTADLDTLASVTEHGIDDLIRASEPDQVEVRSEAIRLIAELDEDLGYVSAKLADLRREVELGRGSDADHPRMTPPTPDDGAAPPPPDIPL